MKKTICYFVILCLLFIPQYLGAQSTSKDKDTQPETKPGSKALVFSLTPINLLGLGSILTGSAGEPFGSSIVLGGFPQIVLSVPASIAGGTGVTLPVAIGIGGKFFFSKNFAFRGGVAFDLVSTTTKGATGFTDAKVSANAFAVQAAALYHFANLYAISAYLGGQFGFALGSQETTPSVRTGSPTGKTNLSATALGAAALLGVEWWVGDGVSIGAEYTIGFTSQSSKAEVTPPTGSSTTTDGPSTTRIGTGAFSIVLGIYF
jgi:opacity protein-like surface antigen